VPPLAAAMVRFGATDWTHGMNR